MIGLFLDLRFASYLYLTLGRMFVNQQRQDRRHGVDSGDLKTRYGYQNKVTF